jgi:hypothetical protein
MSRRRERDPQVNLLRVYELIHQNITSGGKKFMRN